MNEFDTRLVRSGPLRTYLGGVRLRGLSLWLTGVLGSALVGLLSHRLGLGPFSLAAVAAISLACLLALSVQKVHGSAYLVFFFVVVGVAADMLAGHSHLQAQGTQLDRLEAGLLLLAALWALVGYRRQAPIALIVTGVGLLSVELAAYWIHGFPLHVLFTGTSLYLRYFLLAYFVYMSAFDSRDLDAVMKVLAFFILAMTAVAAVQFSTGRLLMYFTGDYGAVTRASLTRAVGFFPWPNEFALFCGTLFFLYASRALSSRLYLVTTIALGVGVILSGTRWSIFLVIGLLLLWGARQPKRWVRSTFLVLAVATIAIAFASTLTSALWDLRFYAEGKSPRIMYFEQGLRVWSDNILFGVGFGRYGTEWDANMEGAQNTVLAKYGIARPVIVLPNGHVRTLATTDSFLASLLPEFGLVGSLILGGFLVVLIRWGVGLARVIPHSSGYTLTILFLALSTLTSSSAIVAPHALILWVVIGLLLKWGCSAYGGVGVTA